MYFLKNSRFSIFLFFFIGLLYFSLNYVPADTSLKQIRKNGVLRVCIPSDLAPYVFEGADNLGVEVELLQLVAAELGVRLSLVRKNQIVSEYNPLNWNINRGTCDLVAGGLVNTDLLRSFMESTEPYSKIDWSILSNESDLAFFGNRVFVYATALGLDRIELSNFLSNKAGSILIAKSPEQILIGLEEDFSNYAIVDSLLARYLSTKNRLYFRDLDIGADNHFLAFALWKGDLTLKREINRIILMLLDRGEIDALLAHYYE